MTITLKKRDPFGRLKSGTMKELSEIGLELLGGRLETIDEPFPGRRPSRSKPVRVGRRRILTLSGCAKFNRRHFFNEKGGRLKLLSRHLGN